MNDLELVKLLEREKKEILLSLLLELCHKNKQNRGTIIILLNKK
jgi:hypothetical protein